jgi:N-acetylmuramoyl-L-alanine amidase
MSFKKVIFFVFLLGFNLAAFSSDLAFLELKNNKQNDKVLIKIYKKNNQNYVAVKDLCVKPYCLLEYQWEKSKLFIIVNKDTQRNTAILSHITHLAWINDEIFSFDQDIINDTELGFLLPFELAKILSKNLYQAELSFIENKAQEIKKQKETLFNVIIIDPGHGGQDVGTSHGKLYEKDITLKYALRLKQSLKKFLPDVEVVLTREKDEYISLEARSKFANQYQNSIFISLHVNHADDTKIHGAETYILNPNATDDDAKKTAMLENDSYLRELKKQKETSTNVIKILAELEQTKFIQRSAELASCIQQELMHNLSDKNVKNRGVKQAMFYVLSQVAMPSVLVEIGFLSNEMDRKHLVSEDFLRDFSDSLAYAIKKWRNKNE